MIVTHEARPIEEACYWLASHRREPTPPLEGRCEVDVAVVGAGLTGLWTAIHLKQLDPGCEVVVLEQRTAAYGASGRNAGIVSEGLDHSHRLAVAHFGRDEARRLAALGRENLDAMLRFLDERGIRCDLERTGTLHVALRPSHLAELREALECARSLGVTRLRLLDHDEVRAELHCERYQGGLLDAGGAILDPVGLVEGLRREAERLGARAYEGTRVLGFEAAGAGLRVRCDSGTLLARRAVLAMNAYTHDLLPGLRFRFIPLYDYIVVSEPLTPAQREAIGWRQRQGVTDARRFFKYYRLTRDERVLWGTSEARYWPGGRVEPACDHSERHYRMLRESFARHFPALSDVRFPYAWGGPICGTTRFTPFFGKARGGRVLYGLGYTGQGLATTHLGGRVLAHMALGRPSPLLELRLVRRKPFPYPPEPLRTWAVKRVTRALRRVDAGHRPGALLRVLDALGIGLSS